jgi:dTDP-4-dehydrorhamnose reductase
VLRMAHEGRELKAATDQVSAPTFAPDLAQWTLELVRRGANGLIHAVNDEGVSRHDWTLAILAEAVRVGLIPPAPPVEKVTTAFFNSTMRRPNYTVMSNEKLTKLLGRRPGSWRPGLRKMLAQMK